MGESQTPIPPAEPERADDFGTARISRLTPKIPVRDPSRRGGHSQRDPKNDLKKEPPRAPRIKRESRVAEKDRSDTLDPEPEKLKAPTRAEEVHIAPISERALEKLGTKPISIEILKTDGTVVKGSLLYAPDPYPLKLFDTRNEKVSVVHREEIKKLTVPAQ